MFWICILNQKVQKEEPMLHSWNIFLNAMIKNMKTNNIFDVIKLSKSKNLNVLIKRIMKIFI